MAAAKVASASFGAEGVDFAKEQGLLDTSPLKLSPAKAILAGGVLRTRTSTRPTLNRRTESARLYEHLP